MSPYTLITALLSAITDGPLDTLARLALADALEEQGKNAEASEQRTIARVLEDPDPFIQAYIETALWSSTDVTNNDTPLYYNYKLEDIHPDTLAIIRKDCLDFLGTCGAMVADDLGMAGHDFWLTRNRHGAGFWDGDWPNDMEDVLTDISHVYGEYGLYVGDDGMIHGY